ncbi:MAG: YlxR family protein [Actinomycetota bacterium]
MSGRRSRHEVPREERARRRRTHARVCMSCRRVRPRSEMARIVRTAGGAEIDREARLPGRGAYVCHDPSCVALVRRRLRVALRAPGINVDHVVRRLEGVDA